MIMKLIYAVLFFLFASGIFNYFVYSQDPGPGLAITALVYGCMCALEKLLLHIYFESKED